MRNRLAAGIGRATRASQVLANGATASYSHGKTSNAGDNLLHCIRPQLAKADVPLASANFRCWENSRHVLKMPPLLIFTRLGHGLVVPLVPFQLFRPGFTGKMRGSLIVLMGLWPSRGGPA